MVKAQRRRSSRSASSAGHGGCRWLAAGEHAGVEATTGRTRGRASHCSRARSRMSRFAGMRSGWSAAVRRAPTEDAGEVGARAVRRGMRRCPRTNPRIARGGSCTVRGRGCRPASAGPWSAAHKGRASPWTSLWGSPSSMANLPAASWKRHSQSTGRGVALSSGLELVRGASVRRLDMAAPVTAVLRIGPLRCSKGAVPKAERWGHSDCFPASVWVIPKRILNVPNPPGTDPRRRRDEQPVREGLHRQAARPYRA